MHTFRLIQVLIVGSVATKDQNLLFKDSGLAAKNVSSNFLILCSGTLFQCERPDTTGTNGNQEGQGLGYKAGESKLPYRSFPNSFNRCCKMRPSVVMMENDCLTSSRD